ncbi:hypothetical protein PG997_014323 [Apiospora hydei]|uniref:2EXR domain-containing protein n=1 Tax=Apiospora hydei TaxID=1337664 RepID=A0ABR1UVX6_9PEZI
MDLPGFAKLPLELQIEIWRHALHAESCERVVPLHGKHVVPHRRLASPFLSVNRASRAEARRFYTVAVPVRALPLFVAPPSSPAGTGTGHGFPASGRPLMLSGHERVHLAFEGHIGEVLPGSESRGVVFLDPVRDVFVTGLDFTPLFAEEALPQLQVPGGINGNVDSGDEDEDEMKRVPAVRPITEALPAQTCREIQNVVLAEWDATGEYQHELTVVEYSEQAAERVWRRDTFSGFGSYQHLWLGVRRENGRNNPSPYYCAVKDECLGNEASCAMLLMLQLQEAKRGERCQERQQQHGGEHSRLGVETWTVLERSNGGSTSVANRPYDVEDPETSGMAPMVSSETETWRYPFEF